MQYDVKKNLFYDSSDTGKSTITSKVRATVRRKIQIFKFIMIDLLLQYDTIPYQYQYCTVLNSLKIQYHWVCV